MLILTPTDFLNFSTELVKLQFILLNEFHLLFQILFL